ncbi:MAG: NERD domain-containing protein [Deltaproteobacteria bacterium]|nr:MAG: NERD domain-containing protein [Deltaproteobacteria bacterium]
MERIFIYFPIILVLVIFIVLMSVLQFYRKVNRFKKRRSPFTHSILRSPGESLIKKLDTINVEINAYIFSLVIIPVLMYSIPFSISYYKGKNLSVIEVYASAIAGLVFITYLLFRIAKLLNERKVTRLGYEGEVAVGQELNQLMLKGYHVYHDFPTDNLNIDHIIVSQSGVFAIETKAHSKPTARSFVENATVSYNGRILLFPQGPDLQTIEQAKRQASWLTNWLYRTVGEQVIVRPVVALPGWYVKRTSPDGIPVVNPKQFASLFKHISPRFLSAEMITRITQQLEQKCLDTEPYPV